MNVVDSCFIDNDFVGKGTIVMESSTSSHFNESNNYGTPDDGLTCSFASVGESCVPFSSTKCSLSGTPSRSVGVSLIVVSIATFWQVVCNSM